MTKNVYIHIPFCKAKCKYCSFVSYPMIKKKEQYIDALEKEIIKRYKGEVLSTLYFGGGTPSLLKLNDFSKIINLFNINSNTEITAEINPEISDKEYLRGLKNLGINRLSIGCQTFNNNILQNIGRRHSSDDVKKVVEYANNAGFSNISIDLIYGLPEQTIKMFEYDLNKAIELDIKHISLYGLKIEENCYFYNHKPQNIPDDDIQADMYLKAIEITEQNGFEHYEISNFAKHGYESKHNLNYWNNSSYYGFGVAAHGYENGIRYSNTTNLEKYIKNPLEHEYLHKLSPTEQIEEEIFLGFRKSSGIDINKIKNEYKIDFNKEYKYILKKYSDYIEKTQQGYKFNKNGFLISNTILSEFIQ